MTNRFQFSADSWQAIGVLTSQRCGLRRRTCEPAAPQGAVQGAVQTAVAKSGKGAVQGAVQGAVHTAVARFGKDAVQGAVQCRVMSRQQWQRCCAGCCSRWCPDCGGEVWQRCCACRVLLRWRGLAKVHGCRVLSRLRCGLAKCGKGSVQGAVQGAVHGAAQSAVARFGKGAA